MYVRDGRAERIFHRRRRIWSKNADGETEHIDMDKNQNKNSQNDQNKNNQHPQSNQGNQNANNKNNQNYQNKK